MARPNAPTQRSGHPFAGSAMAHFDYFLSEQRPTVVHRATDTAWEWAGGEWRQRAGERVVSLIYENGAQMDRDAFVQNYPFVVVKLLEVRP